MKVFWKLLKNRNWTFPVVRYFTWKLELVSDILLLCVETFFYLYLPPDLFKFNFYDIFANSEVFHTALT